MNVASFVYRSSVLSYMKHFQYHSLLIIRYRTYNLSILKIKIMDILKGMPGQCRWISIFVFHTIFGSGQRDFLILFSISRVHGFTFFTINVANHTGLIHCIDCWSLFWKTKFNHASKYFPRYLVHMVLKHIHVFALFLLLLC